jgi:hypothetical protein
VDDLGVMMLIEEVTSQWALDLITSDEALRRIWQILRDNGRG